jgi:hypothetical protein
MGHIKPLSAEQEQQAVDAILALGWTEDGRPLSMQLLPPSMLKPS